MSIHQAGIGAESPPIAAVFHDHTGIEAVREDGILGRFSHKGDVWNSYGNLLFIKAFVDVKNLGRGVVRLQGSQGLRNCAKISGAVL